MRFTSSGWWGWELQCAVTVSFPLVGIICHILSPLLSHTGTPQESYSPGAPPSGQSEKWIFCYYPILASSGKCWCPEEHLEQGQQQSKQEGRELWVTYWGSSFSQLKLSWEQDRERKGMKLCVILSATFPTKENQSLISIKRYGNIWEQQRLVSCEKLHTLAYTKCDIYVCLFLTAICSVAQRCKNKKACLLFLPFLIHFKVTS